MKSMDITIKEAKEALLLASILCCCPCIRNGVPVSIRASK